MQYKEKSKQKEKKSTLAVVVVAGVDLIENSSSCSSIIPGCIKIWYMGGESLSLKSLPMLFLKVVTSKI